jgi:small subunit ribosomal protein S16
MALMIRMRQQGASSRQRFRIVLTDARNPRDGKYIEKLGWYNPFAPHEKNLFLQLDRLEYWLGMGAGISDRVKSLVYRVAPEVTRRMGERKQARRAKARAKRKKRLAQQG